MAAKNLVKDVINKGNMLVVLNLQQMGLLFRIIFKKLHNSLLCLPLGKQSNFIPSISRIIEKSLLGRSFYLMFALHKFKLFNKYCTIS